MRNFLSAVLCLLLLIPLVRFTYAESGYSYDETTKTLTLTANEQFEDDSWKSLEIEHLVIAGSVTGIPASAFADRQDLLTLKITSPCEVINNTAFYSCQNLCKIDLGKSLKRIGLSVFSGSCITEVEFPDGFERLGESSFYKCFELEKVALPDSLTVIEPWAFYYCSSLKSVELPKNLQKLSDCAFYRNHSLESIVIPASVTEMGGAVFYEDFSLKSVTLLNSPEIIDENTFEGCTSLREIYLPESVKEIRCLGFARCTNLRCVHILSDEIDVDSGAFEDSDCVVVFGNKACTDEVSGKTGVTVSSESEFCDIPSDCWYGTDARYCFGRNLLKGTSESAFSPDSMLSSDMLCLILAKMSGADLSGYSDEKWYSASNEWAKKYLPDVVGKDTLTRFDVISSLYKLFGKGDLSWDGILPFDDISALSEEQTEAVRWAYEKHIAIGTSENTFSPEKSITRAEAAVIISNCLVNI